MMDACEIAATSIKGDAKRIKLDQNGNVHNGVGQAVLGTILCPQCKTANASHRCMRQACRTCCSAAATAAADAGDSKAQICEQHAAKDRKEEEKKEFRRKSKEAKKARAAANKTNVKAESGKPKMQDGILESGTMTTGANGLTATDAA